MDNSSKPCGRRHHRRKTDDEQQWANKENISVLQQLKSTDIIPDSSLALPRHRQRFSETQYCKVEEGSSGLGEVTASVIIDADHTWNVYVGEKEVLDTCGVLARFRSPFTDDRFSDTIDNADLCPRNPDEKFILVVKDKGEIVRGARGTGDVITSIDNSVVRDHSGKQYHCTQEGRLQPAM